MQAMTKVLPTLLLLVLPVFAEDLPKPAKAPAARPATGAAITRESLVGTWYLDMELGGVRVQGATEYKADGTLQGRARFAMEDETIDLAVKGTWKLDGKTITTTVTQSSNPEMMPVGEVSKDEILELTASTLRYRDEEGQVVTETRQKPKPGGQAKSAGKPVAPDEVKAIHAALRKMQGGFREGDYEAIRGATHPSLIEQAGGEEKFRESTEKALSMLQSGKIKVGDDELGTPSGLHEAGEDWVCFVPKRNVIEVDGRKVRSQGFYVAVKNKTDGSWKFLDGAGMRNDPEMLWTLLPDVPRGIELPPVKREIVSEKE
jgi:hypothetical protein